MVAKTEVRTLYWDAKDSRWVLIVMRKPFVRHHKATRTVIERSAAETWAKDAA